MGVFTAVLRKPLDVNLLLSFYASLGKTSHFTLVDDDPAMYRSLADILHLRGYAVVEAADPAVLPEPAEKDKRAFLLNLAVSSPLGLEVLSRLSQTCRQTPVVVVTAYREAMRQTLERALQFNAYTCLYHPHEIEGLIESLQNIL
jgi:DNA-binding NtrC family response regulator